MGRQARRRTSKDSIRKPEWQYFGAIEAVKLLRGQCILSSIALSGVCLAETFMLGYMDYLRISIRRTGARMVKSPVQTYRRKRWTGRIPSKGGICA